MKTVAHFLWFTVYSLREPCEDVCRPHKVNRPCELYVAGGPKFAHP